MNVVGGEAIHGEAPQTERPSMLTTRYDPYDSIGVPDARLMERLAQQVRVSSEPMPFVRGGQALASAILRSRVVGTAPMWVGTLAEALGASLALMLRRTLSGTTADQRVELATAAVALSIVRPDLSEDCDAAVRAWLSYSTPRQHQHAHLLAARTLLHLLLDEGDLAAETVDALVGFNGESAGWILHDWAVSRVQQHGLSRETHCFHNLRVALASAEPASARSCLQLLAGVAIVTRAGHPRVYTLRWLEAVARDVEHVGTSSLSAVG